VRKGSPQLLAELNAFLARYPEGSLTRNVLLQKYLKSVKFAKSATTGEDMKRFREVVGYLRKYGDEYGLDYLLVAAQGYQESGLDHSRRSQVGAIMPEQRKQIINSSVLAGHYEKAIDRESAYEKLQARAGEKTQSAGAPPVAEGESTTERPQSSVLADALGTVTAAFKPTIGPRGAVHDSFATSMAKSAMRAASSSIGRQIARGILGGILGGGSRRR